MMPHQTIRFLRFVAIIVAGTMLGFFGYLAFLAYQYAGARCINPDPYDPAAHLEWSIVATVMGAGVAMLRRGPGPTDPD